MAELSDLKHMVMSFRVSELQVLLGYMGRNKSGRKQEILQRALTYVSKGCPTAVQIKIRELYRRRFPGKEFSSASIKTQPRVPNPSSSAAVQNCFGSAVDYRKQNGSSGHSSMPINPDVRLKKLPFYEKLGELLKPSSLVPRSQSRFQETFFVFHLTPQQAQDIAMSRDMRPSSRASGEYAVQVQLRFCLLETSCDQEDNFPPSICVRVNGKMAALPNPIPTNKPGVEPKRPSRPVNITQICRISPTVPNHMNISWASELGRSYCVNVSLVRRLTSEMLLTRLKSNGQRHPDHTRALIKEKLSHDPDSEIATTSLRVSLKCPLGKMKMSIPSRASTCNHLQCFDAPTFLQMNEKKPTWVCPVCDKPAEFDNLLTDGLFTEILQQAPESLEIEFMEDGSWHPMKQKETSSNSCSSANSSLVICQTIDGDSSPKKPKEEAIECIDLTETDDEDEEEMTIAHSSMATPILSDTSSSSSRVPSPTPFYSMSDMSGSVHVGSSVSSSNNTGNSSLPEPIELRRALETINPGSSPLWSPPQSPSGSPPTIFPMSSSSPRIKLPPPPPLIESATEDSEDQPMDDFDIFNLLQPDEKMDKNLMLNDIFDIDSNKPKTPSAEITLSSDSSNSRMDTPTLPPSVEEVENSDQGRFSPDIIPLD